MSAQQAALYRPHIPYSLQTTPLSSQNAPFDPYLSYLGPWQHTSHIMYRFLQAVLNEIFDMIQGSRFSICVNMNWGLSEFGIKYCKN